MFISEWEKRMGLREGRCGAEIGKDGLIEGERGWV